MQLLIEGIQAFIIQTPLLGSCPVLSPISAPGMQRAVEGKPLVQGAGVRAKPQGSQGLGLCSRRPFSLWEYPSTNPPREQQLQHWLLQFICLLNTNGIQDAGDGEVRESLCSQDVHLPRGEDRDRRGTGRGYLMSNRKKPARGRLRGQLFCTGYSAGAPAGTQT